MTLYYSLRIDTSSDEQIDIVNRIIGVKSNRAIAGWELELSQKEEDNYIPFIDYFLSILKDKYSLLEEIGISRSLISIWLLYEYENQCNLEFSPKDMYNLGKEGIVLCVSCWEQE